MRLRLAAAGALALVLCLPAWGRAGPLRVRNTHPLFLAAPSPVFQSARCETAFEADLNYSSTYLVEDTDRWSVGLDMEAAVLDLGYRMAFGEALEVGIGIPLISYNSGVLDGPLDDFHSSLGLGDYGRSRRPKNDFLFVVKRDGQTIVKGEAGEASVGDLRLSVKNALYARGPVLSVQGFLELPTGDPDGGYGNGGLDLGFAALLDAELGDAFDLYLNAGAVFPDDYDTGPGIELDDYVYGAAGLGWKFSPGVSFGLQVLVQQSPYSTGIRELDAPSSILSAGTSLGIGRDAAFEITFSEDLNTAGAPDFMLSVGLKSRL